MTLQRVSVQGDPARVLTMLGFEKEFEVRRRGTRYLVPNPARSSSAPGIVDIFRVVNEAGQPFSPTGWDGPDPYVVSVRFPLDSDSRVDADADAVAALVRSLRPHLDVAVSSAWGDAVS